MNELLIKYVVPPVLTAVVGLVVAALNSWRRKLDADASNTILVHASEKTIHLVEIVVSEIEQTLRPQLAAAAADGKLSPEEKSQLKIAAIAKIKAYLGPDGIKQLMDALRIPEEKVVEYIASLIESAIFNSK